MKIGIDIDDTISDTSFVMFPKMLEEDKRKRNTGIVHNDEYLFKPNGRFDWSDEEIDTFLYNNFEQCCNQFPVIKDADKVISQLLNEGHEIYLITARSPLHWRNREICTENWLKANGIKYTKLIFSESRDKTDEIKSHGVDVMVDDSVSSCLKMENNGIKCILKISPYNAQKEDLMPFKRKAADWNDIYKIINQIK